MELQRIERVGLLDTLRTTIRCDSVAFQSSARIERWDGDRWQLVHELHYSKMKTKASAYQSSPPTANQFAADAGDLLQVALRVLNLPEEAQQSAA